VDGHLGLVLLWGELVISYKDTLTFSADGSYEAELDGFWPAEDGFVWSKGKWSEIRFPFEKDNLTEHSDLIMDLDVFKPEDGGQNVLIYLNGLRVGSKFIKNRITCVISFPSSILRKDNNVLTLDTPDAMIPADFGIADTRQLGVQLYSIQIRRC